MTYNEDLHDKVREHPMDEFQKMADLEEGDNYGSQFANLLNGLSTNVIIPAEDTTAFKQWVADHANGERVYAEIAGELAVAESAVESPTGPDDINIKSVSIDQSALENEIQSASGVSVQETPPENPTEGDEWVDSSFRKPAKKTYMGDGEWATLVPGSNVPGETTYTSNAEVDVSNINETVRIELVAEEGGSARWSPGGAGGAGIVEVDLTPYDKIQVRPGLKGHNPSRGTKTDWDEVLTSWHSATGGRGVAVQDGKGNTIAIAGGGGGEADYGTYYDDGYRYIEGASGGEGGPTGTEVGGNGGSFSINWHSGYDREEIQTHYAAEDGGITTKQDSATVVSANTARGEKPSVTLFK